MNDYGKNNYVTLREVVAFFKESDDDLRATAEKFGLKYHKAHYTRDGIKEVGHNAELFLDGEWYSLQKMKRIAYGKYVPKRSRSKYERAKETKKIFDITPHTLSLSEDSFRIRKDSTKIENVKDNYESAVSVLDKDLDLYEKKLNKCKEVFAKANELLNEIEDNALPFSKNQKQMVAMVMRIGKQNINSLQDKVVTMRMQVNKLREKHSMFESERHNNLKEKKLNELVNKIEATGIKLTEKQKNSLRDSLDKEQL